jgi:hypothetical protein
MCVCAYACVSDGCLTPQGYYCLMLKLTIVAGTGRMAGYIPVPPNDLHSMAQVGPAGSSMSQPVVAKGWRFKLC